MGGILRLIAAGRYLRRIGDWMGRFPSAGFGLAYLVAVPLFALLYYWFLPVDFYHATARYEPAVQQQAQSVSVTLRDIFIAAARSEDRDRPTINGAPVPTSQQPEFPMFTIQPEPDRVRILALFLFVDQRPPLFWVALDLAEGGQMQTATDDPPPGGPAKWLFFTDVNATTLSGGSLSLPHLFPCKGDRARRKTCLQMTLTDYSTLLSLRSTALGAPTPLQASYLRMFYFSAVTISTLGYGDIVPVTSRARAVVTVEVILGPLLFGLFLNSLLKERSGLLQGVSVHVAPTVNSRDDG